MAPRRQHQAIELFVLSAFAVAQPLFDLLGHEAAFFVAHRSGAAVIVAFAAVLLLVPPAILYALVRVASALSLRLGEGLHTLFIGVLAGLTIAPPLMRALQLTTGWWLAAIALGAGPAIWMHRRWAYRDNAISWTMVAPATFAILFLLGSPVRDLVIASDDRGAHAEARSPTPVIVLVLDELPLDALLRPDGTLDAVRFPGFARLASRSTWYPNATTNADGTVHALPALLTGRWLRASQLPTSQSFPNNLLTYVGRTYPLFASEFVTALCAPDVCSQSRPTFGLPALLHDTAIVYLHASLPQTIATRWLPSIGNRWAGFDDGEHRALRPFTSVKAAFDAAASAEEPARVDDLLTALESTSDTRLWYLHLGMPHVPWRWLPDGHAYSGAVIGGLTPDERWATDDAAVAHGLQRFLLQLRSVDTMLGRLLDRMHDTGLDERALLIVLSDHGESFRPGAPRRDFDVTHPGELLSIPLFVHYPGQSTARVDGRLAELVDVAPTIGDVLDLPLPWPVDGESLLSESPSRQERHIFTRLAGLQPFTGGPVPERGSLSSRIDMLFGAGGHPDDIYRLGPYRELIGHVPEVADNALTVPDVHVAIESPEVLASVDPSSTVLPALVTARLTGAIAAGTPVAMTLNGTVAGVGWTQSAPEGSRAMLMLAPRFFRSGDNRVGVFRIEPGGALTPLSQDSTRGVQLLAPATGGAVSHLVRPDGRVLPIVDVSAGLRGHVERLTRSGQTVSLNGYLIDTSHNQAPELFVVTQGRRVLTTTLPWPRPDVGTYFKMPDLIYTGLQVSAPLPGPVTDLAVYALFADRAYRLPWLAGATAAAAEAAADGVTH